MPTNKGYLTAKSIKESDKYYIPIYAVEPLLQYLDRGNKSNYLIFKELKRK